MKKWHLAKEFCFGEVKAQHIRSTMGPVCGCAPAHEVWPAPKASCDDPDGDRRPAAPPTCLSREAVRGATRPDKRMRAVVAALTLTKRTLARHTEAAGDATDRKTLDALVQALDVMTYQVEATLEVDRGCPPDHWNAVLGAWIADESKVLQGVRVGKEMESLVEYWSVWAWCTCVGNATGHVWTGLMDAASRSCKVRDAVAVGVLETLAARGAVPRPRFPEATAKRVVSFVLGCCLDRVAGSSVAARAFCRAVAWLAGGLADGTRCEPARRLLSKRGGGTMVLRVMERHVESAEVQEAACRVVRELSEDYDNRVTMVREGGLRLIFTAMNRHLGNAGVQEQGCGALKKLSLKAGNRVAIVEQGGLRRIFSAMDRHVDHAGVQEQGCRVLRNMSHHCTDDQVPVVGQGGLRRVFTAMERHVDRAGVQKAACACLWELSCKVDNRGAIVRQGGLKHVLAAMDHHVGNAGVQAQGCAVLCMLSRHHANHVAIVGEGGLRCIFTALERHADDLGVQMAAWGSLKKLSYQSAENRAAIKAGDGVQRLCAVKERHGSNPSIVSWADAVLQRLS